MMVSYAIDTNINNMVRFLSSISKYQYDRLITNNNSYKFKIIDGKICTDYLLDMANEADIMMNNGDARNNCIVFFMSTIIEEELFRGLIGNPDVAECYLLGRPCVLLSEDHIGNIVGFAVMINDHINYISMTRFEY